MKLHNYPFLLFLILSCNHLPGKPGISEDIDESKKNNIFICEYRPIKKRMEFKNGAVLDVDVAWLEKKWSYSSDSKKINTVNGYQLIVHTINKVDDDYSFTWTIGVDFARNFRRCGYTCIITDFDTLSKSEESWKIQKGRNLDGKSPLILIGEFVLIKR